MPSPLGHALAGIAAGWAVGPPLRARSADGRRLTSLCALAAMLPDLDLLARVHRGPAHSLAAAATAGGLLWCVAAWRSRGMRGRPPAVSAARLALAVAAAYATHILLDWLGADSSPPIGIMAAWPVSHGFFAAPRPLFLAISRRYWLPDFWMLNLRAVAREVLMLGPLVLMVWRIRRRQSRPAGDRPGEEGG